MFERKVTYSAFGILMLGLAGCGDRGQASLPSLSGPEIVNGKAVTKKDKLAESIVAITTDSPEGQALCTGSIIDEETVLTAAHCVDGPPTQLTIVFSTDIKDAKPGMTRKGDRFKQHSKWKKGSAEGLGDLALIHFSGGLPAGYQPVRMVDKSTPLDTGTEVLMAGFGVNDGTQRTGAGSLRVTESTILGNVLSSEVVTDGRKTSVCFGDSGGPAFIQEGDELVQWGVAHSVSSQACDQTSVHTNIQSYEAWIKSNVLKLTKKGEKGEGRKKPRLG